MPPVVFIGNLIFWCIFYVVLSRPSFEYSSFLLLQIFVCLWYPTFWFVLSSFVFFVICFAGRAWPLGSWSFRLFFLLTWDILLQDMHLLCLIFRSHIFWLHLVNFWPSLIFLSHGFDFVFIFAAYQSNGGSHQFRSMRLCQPKSR